MLTASAVACPPPVLFGGYSSGAHVAASLLQRPDLLKLRGLPAPSEGLCDGVMHISGLFLPKPCVVGSVPARLAKLLISLVFGPAAPSLPSVLARAELSPRLPHLLIDCEREAFGVWPIEGLMQCLLGGAAYAVALQNLGVSVMHVTVRSNHWGMLSSTQLDDALRRHMCTWPKA
uniref:Alpha/beta hydrolase fold-3 domain-containing protein n=1 Tax=Calcidiscus leptoporus TaxID=127549 RepID=A0A7S0IWT4_9EUKA|mmetsp:Transcript_26110/g.60991  ORF Transcript_26110/g.60991 Transcript_26110/m.60991 type:complete len:175 (+) Transcript_26110:47-571(+)